MDYPTRHASRYGLARRIGSIDRMRVSSMPSFGYGGDGGTVPIVRRGSPMSSVAAGAVCRPIMQVALSTGRPLRHCGGCSSKTVALRSVSVPGKRKLLCRYAVCCICVYGYTCIKGTYFTVASVVQ